MKFSEQKKAWIGWSALISVILGLFVIGAVVTGIIGPGVGFAKKKFFDEEETKWVFPWTKQEFEPYVPEEYFDAEEVIVSDSMKAMQCALNSVAVGIFDYENDKVCPSGYVKLQEEESPNLFKRLFYTEGFKGIRYGQTQVGCSGISSEFLSFKNKTPEESIELFGDAIEDCWTKSQKVNLENDFLRCATYDYNELNQDLLEIESTSITKNIKEYLREKGTEDSKKAAKQFLMNFLNLKKKYREGCVYLIRNKQEMSLNNEIAIGDCWPRSYSYPVDSFSCSVTSFELPQKVSNSTFLHALGDPKYLVYYEKFPEEATAYWHKEASDIWNLYTIGYVTVSGVLNVGRASKVAKIEKKALAKGAIKQIEKVVGEAIATTTEKEISKQLLKRAEKASLKNIIRTLAVEQEAKTIYGVGKVTSHEIGEILTKTLGQKSGKEAFEIVEKDLSRDILKIVEKNVKQIDPNFIGDLPAYRKRVVNLIIKGETAPAGKVIRRGAKRIFIETLTPDAIQKILKKQTYRQFFQQFGFKEGTKTLDEALLTKAAEKSLQRLKALKSIDNNLVEKSFRKGLREVEEIFLGGTIGWKQGDSVLALAKKQVPSILPSNKWLLTRPGYVGAAIGHTTFIGIPKWVKDHQLPLILLLSVYIDSIDSGNEKYIPVGVNSIALTQPTLLSPKVTYELNEEATQYFIRNKEKPDNVMYLVSPCKANFRVVKRKCDCDSNPKASIFDFGSGLMNAEYGTITLKDYEERLMEYEKEWEALSEKKDREKYVEERFIEDNRMFSTYVETGTAISKLKPSKQISIQREKLDSLQNVIDSENSVKICNEIGFLQAIGVTKQAKYNIDCIEIEPEPLNDSYCYDREDVFKNTKYIRIGVTVVSFAIDAVIIGFTGGWALPAVLLISNGAALGAIEVQLESMEKWPGS